MPPPVTPTPYFPALQASAPALQPTVPNCIVNIPPGYALVPATHTFTPGPALEQQLVASELAIVNSQIGQLRRERKSLAGPIVQMVLGYGGMVVSSAVAVGTYTAATDESTGRGNQDTLKRTAYGFSGLAVASLLLGFSGTVRLVRRAAQNRSLNAQLKPLAARRIHLAQQLMFGGRSVPGLLHP
jgi:hypothetical protein